MPKITDEPRLIRIIHRTLTSPKLPGELVCYAGTSQYASRGAGSAACGLAAASYARVAFELDQNRISGESDSSEFLRRVLGRASVEEAVGICERWAGDAHMEVEDILAMPILDRAMRVASTRYGQPGLDDFRSVLTEMVEIKGSAAAIITRPPEILAVLKLSLTPTLNTFIIFDSHPRPRYPTGTGLLIFASPEGAARALTDLFPTVDLNLPEGDLQWQAQLLSNYSAHILVPRPVFDGDGGRERWKDVAMDASLEVLALRERVRGRARVRGQNERLGRRVDELEGLLRRERAKGKRAEGSERYAPYGKEGAAPGALRATASNASGSGAAPQDAKQPSTTKTATPTDDSDAAFNHALALQQTYDTEHARLAHQLAALTQTAQRTFRCEVCFDELPEDVVMRVEGCGHGFCRECVRGHVLSRLGEHRWPILCPVCAAGREDGKKPCVITEELIHFVELTPDQFNTYTEMQLSQFSTLLHCRKCKQSAWVDKQDVSEAAILVCPLQGCGYAYCKDCSQAVQIDGMKHSCDGSAELEALMRERGWKYCPACKTPIQKDSGCNHMTCISPACNTHFCYRCGESIVQSARRQTVSQAVSRHYTRCQLFEIPGNAA